MFSREWLGHLRLVFPWVLLGFFLAGIFCLNVTYSYSSDDCSYGLAFDVARQEGERLNFGEQLREASRTVEVPPYAASLGQVWETNAADGYRPVVHFFARAFTGWLGKGAFNVANTLVMGALLLLIGRLACGRWRPTVGRLALTLALVFLVLCKGESYLWCAGSVNYLWAGVMTLGFCLMRERLEHDAPGMRWSIVPMMALALIFGWAQESFALPVCFALGVWTLCHLRELRLGKVLVFGAYGIGALLLCLVAVRRFDPVGTASSFSFLSFVLTQLKIAAAVKGVWALLLCLLFMKDRLAILRRNGFELLVVLGSLLMISVVGFNGERSLWCANLFAIVVVVREFSPPRWLSVGIVALFVPLFAVLLSLGFQIKANFDTMVRLFLASRDGVTCHERVQCGPFARFFHQAIYTWQSNDGHGTAFALYHGRRRAPIALSRELYERLYLEDAFCVPENRIAALDGLFYTTPTANAIVMPLPETDGTDWETRRVRVTYDWPRGLLARVRQELAVRRSPPVPNRERPQVLTTTHGRYLLIAKIPGGDRFIRDVDLGEER